MQNNILFFRNFRSLKLSVVFCLLCFYSSVYAQHELKRIAIYNNIDGIQLAYSRGGKITLYNVGTADSKHLKKINSNTIFRAGSLGKTVLAYIVMRLYDRGEIALDTPLLHYIKEEYKRFDKNDSRFNLITARMVLSHTSGLEFYGDSTAKLSAMPGKGFSYSSEGYFFLQNVIEKITGKPLQALAEDEVFIPFDMKHSSYVRKPYHDAAILGADDFEPNAAFSLYTTAADYNVFLQALLTGKGLKVSTNKIMFTTCSDAQWPNRKAVEADKHIDWGLGVGLQFSDNEKAIWHWGSIMGTFNSFYIAYPNTGESLVYFTNSLSGLRAANQLAQLYLDKNCQWPMQWLKLGYEHPMAMAALYKRFNVNAKQNIGVIIGTLKHKGYVFSANDLDFFANALADQNYTRQSITVFKYLAGSQSNNAAIFSSLGKLYLKLGDKNLALKNFRHSWVLDTGNTNTAYHIKALIKNTYLQPNELAAFAGKYKLNIMDGIFIDIEVTQSGLVMNVLGTNDRSVFYPVSATEFLNYNTGFTMKFIKDKGGAISAVLIHTKNTADIWERSN